MKQILYAILALILLAPSSAAAQAQTSATSSPANIVERIQEESEGEIIIDIPEEIMKEILEEPSQRQSGQQRKGGQSSGRQKVTNSGFRIQIFSDGRNQATLRSRATARANAVCARFPKYRGQVYTFSKAPNWYARVGNFKSRDEANAALGELKRAFPAFASEMRIVQSAIVPTK